MAKLVFEDPFLDSGYSEELWNFSIPEEGSKLHLRGKYYSVVSITRDHGTVFVHVQEL